MVSDFVDEVGGFMRTQTKEACLLLEVSKDGYFNNDHLLEQVERTITIFEEIHPHARGLFLFDNAPSNKKMAENALNVERMNVNPGAVGKTRNPEFRMSNFVKKNRERIDTRSDPHSAIDHVFAHGNTLMC